VADSLVGLNSGHILLFQKICFKIIFSKSFFFALPIAIHLIYPFQDVDLFGSALGNLEVGEWPHLSVYESVPEDEFFGGDVRLFL